MPGFHPRGKVAVVTGAGGGIGRALVRAIAGSGARSVLALDLHQRSAEETAALCKAESPGCVIRPHTCDAGDGAALKRLLASSEEPIDMFCANAGVATAGNCATSSDADWEETFRLNVMQLVWAAGELVPSFERRGGGALMVTASAAGLLSQLGSAPYTATKHAVVGLAEWLAITHGDAGVSVCCVCPQGVNTPMATGLMEGADPTVRALAADGLIEPEEVAAEALDALARGTFLCMPGGDKKGPAKHVQRKAADRERWIDGMRRFQRKLAK